MRCADCGTSDSGIAYLMTDSGIRVCENCWMRGSY